jgi:hypothetical protein
LGSDDFSKEDKGRATLDLDAALEAGWSGFEIAERVPLLEIARAHELVEHPARRGATPTCRRSCHGAEQATESMPSSRPFDDVGQFWNVDSFTPEDIFGEGDKVAVFGRFTYTSTKMRKTVTSSFAILFRLKGDKVKYMQFMEDTFCTASSFRSGGKWKFQSDPNGSEVEI